MLSVSRTEGIHHVAVSIAGKCLGKFLLACLHGLLGFFVSRIVLFDADGLAFLFGMVAEVLEHESLAHLQSLGSVLSLSAIGSKRNRATEGFLHGTTNLAQGKFGIYLAFGLTHVTHNDGCTTVCNNLFQSGEGAANAGIVRNLTILIQGHVEVNAHDCLFTGKVVIRNSHNINVLCCWFKLRGKGTTFLRNVQVLTPNIPSIRFAEVNKAAFVALRTQGCAGISPVEDEPMMCIGNLLLCEMFGEHLLNREWSLA